jgi:hypothetical protein
LEKLEIGGSPISRLKLLKKRMLSLQVKEKRKCLSQKQEEELDGIPGSCFRQT